LPQPQLDRENTAGRRVGARSVNNKIQKRAVNPLTRHASRSVMGSNYQSPQVEGPAAVSDPLPDRTAHQTAGRCDAFQRGISRLAPQRQALP